MTDQLTDIVYDIPAVKSETRRHTLAVLVDNEFGVLARVIGLFSGRGYNIESLTVAEVEHGKHKNGLGRSRITIVTSGTEATIEQIKRLLEKMVPVYKVHDLTVEGAHIERELALVKVAIKEATRVEVLKVADMFHARIIPASDVFIFEMTGETQKIDTFIEHMQKLGLVEICRTGVAAVGKHKEGI